VADFLAWWDTNSNNFSLVVPPGIDAIQVMTIHRSKGLQFPVVIIPFAYHDLSRTTKKGQWVELDLQEIPELKTTWIGLSASGLAQTPFESLHTHEMAKSYLDTLNMMYVAFTRAENKLFVITKKSKSYKSSTMHGLLQHFLEAEGLWTEDQMCYTFGDFDSTLQTIPNAANVSDSHGEQNTLTNPMPSTGMSRPAFLTIPSEPWSKALRMKSHQTERNPETGNPDYLERGNLLHRAMEKIQSQDDIEVVLGSMLANGEIDKYRKQEWTVKIRQLIDLPDIGPYFAKNIRVKPEAGIFDQNGNFFRPDRVVLLDSETIIIDYKTGRQYEKHQSQMETYASLLRQMGYPNVKKYVLYLDQGKVVVC
jgi:ATP-dependent exoDNAse (exonuclease V) beta subunit